MKNKSSTVKAKEQLAHNVMTFKEIEAKSQVVRNDLTNTQQKRLSKKITIKLWRESRKGGFDSRGRKLKISEFPELSLVLEKVFQVKISVFLYSTVRVRVIGEYRI